MIFDASYSEIGRTTGQQLNALRRQLGVGIDPVFDYSQMTDLQKKIKQKEKKPRNGSEDATGQDMVNSVSSLGQMRRALRNVLGDGAAPEESEDHEGDINSPIGQGISPPLADARLLRENQRPSSMFMAKSRDEVAKLDIEKRFRAPPIGTYQPVSDLCRPRLKGLADFNLRTNTKSLKAVELEKEVTRLQAENQPYDHLIKNGVSVELLEEIPDMKQRVPCKVDISKTLPRSEHLHVCNENSFTAGALEGDLKCSHLRRNPSWDIKKMSSFKPKSMETYFEPGQYQVKVDTVRPRIGMKNMPFNKQRSRKSPRERVGRIEVESRLGTHLPDRSASWSCPRLSNALRVSAPNFSKTTDRPDVIQVVEYHNADNPEADQTVYEHDLTFNAMEANKVLWNKTKSVENFSTSLQREQQSKIMRHYVEDVSRCRTRDNLTRGPVSVELLSDIDGSPALRRRVNTTDFSRMGARSPEKKYTESPPRKRDPGKAAKFEREVRMGDARSEAQQLSDLTSGIIELRAARTCEALPKSAHAE